MTSERENRIEIPVLALRDVVVYPHMVIPLFVGREKSIRCLEAAMDSDKQIFLVAQKDAGVDEPDTNDIYSVGTIATILQLLKLPDGTVKVLVEGNVRGEIAEYNQTEPYFIAGINRTADEDLPESEQEVLIRSAVSQFEGYVKLNKKIPPEVLTSLNGIDDAARLADTMAAHMPLKLVEKQKVLEMKGVNERLEYLMALMEGEIDLLQVEKKIRTRVKKQMEKSQREYYLNEQMKAIQKELGELDDAPDEFEALSKKIEEAKMPAEAEEKAKAELQKLKMMSPMSAEATVVRSYIDWLTSVPWHKRSAVKKNLAKAEEILNADHYGLEKVKERIIEYLAVQQRVRKLKGPILCLVGPPGVGKTSLGQSVAKATGRKYVRMALGGVRDEAEIRGHRKTYIGAMPGRILQNLKKAGTSNPVFVLDEIDKLSNSNQGDPSSALLEVLDPEQNAEFHDNFLELGFDLSKVMFIATANNLGSIQPALRDRMEIINVTGYTIEEKVEIGKRHLLPKQLKEHGVKSDQLKIGKPQLEKIVEGYTRESGVRGLEKQIAKMVRYAAKNIAMEEEYKVKVDTETVIDVLGAPKLERNKYENNEVAGVVTGLAWTQVGGDILFIESILSKGKGNLTVTGNLGKVMKESATLAMEYIKSNADALELNPSVFENYNVHIHVPEGATPKDGPSAGITMLTSLVSLFTQRKVKKNIAMTGEITLRGKVLPVGGIKEKILAAKRAHIKEIIMCAENERDIKEINAEYLKGLTFHYVHDMSEVLELALTKDQVKNAKIL